VQLYFFFKLKPAISFLSFDFFGDSGSIFSVLLNFVGIAHLVYDQISNWKLLSAQTSPEKVIIMTVVSEFFEQLRVFSACS